MPTYEYQCTECGKSFEHFQRLSDPPLRKCPECGGRVKRLISACNLIIKADSDTTRCGAKTPCCGLDKPCPKPPCEE